MADSELRYTLAEAESLFAARHCNIWNHKPAIQDDATGEWRCECGLISYLGASLATPEQLAGKEPSAAAYL